MIFWDYWQYWGLLEISHGYWIIQKDYWGLLEITHGDNYQAV